MAQLSVFKPEQAIRIMKLIMGGGRPPTPGPLAKAKKPIGKKDREKLRAVGKDSSPLPPGIQAQIEAEYGPSGPLIARGIQHNYPKQGTAPLFHAEDASYSPEVMGLEAQIQRWFNEQRVPPKPNLERDPYDVSPEDLARQMAYEKERRITEAQIKDAQVLKGVQDPGANTANIMAGMTPGPDGRSVDEMLRHRAGIHDGMSYNQVLEALDRINPGNQGDANFAEQIALAHLFRDYAYPQFGSTGKEVQSSSPSFDDFLEHERATLYSRKQMAEARRFAPLVTPSVDDPYYGKASGTSSRLSPTFGTVMKNTFSMMPHKQFDDDVRQANKLGVLTPRGFKTALMMKMFGGPMMGLHPERLHLDNSLRTGGATTPDMVAEAMREIKARFGDAGDARDIATHNVVGPKKFNQLWFPEAPMAANPNAALAGADAANGLMRADTIKFQGHNVNQRVLEAMDNLRSHARSPKLAGILSNLQDEFYKNPDLAHTGFKPKPTAVSMAQVGPEYGRAVDTAEVRKRQRAARNEDQGSKKSTNKDLVVLKRTKDIPRTWAQQQLSNIDGPPDLTVPKDPGDSNRRLATFVNQERPTKDGGPVVPPEKLEGARAAGDFLWKKTPPQVFLPMKRRVKEAAREAGSRIGARNLSGETSEQKRFNKSVEGKELLHPDLSPWKIDALDKQIVALRAANDPNQSDKLERLVAESTRRKEYIRTMDGGSGDTLDQWYSNWKSRQIGMGGERAFKKTISPGEAQLHDFRTKESAEPIGPDRERTPKGIYRKAVLEADNLGVDTDSPEFEDVVRSVAKKQVGPALKRDREFIDEKLKTTGLQNKRLALAKNLPSRLVKRDVGAAIKDPESFVSRFLKGARENAYKNTKSKNIAASTVRPRVQPPTGTPATPSEGPGRGQLDEPHKLDLTDNRKGGGIVRVFNPLKRARSLRDKPPVQTPLTRDGKPVVKNAPKQAPEYIPKGQPLTGDKPSMVKGVSQKMALSRWNEAFRAKQAPPNKLPLNKFDEAKLTTPRPGARPDATREEKRQFKLIKKNRRKAQLIPVRP